MARTVDVRLSGRGRLRSAARQNLVFNPQSAAESAVSPAESAETGRGGQQETHSREINRQSKPKTRVRSRGPRRHGINGSSAVWRLKKLARGRKALDLPSRADFEGRQARGEGRTMEERGGGRGGLRDQVKW